MAKKEFDVQEPGKEVDTQAPAAAKEVRATATGAINVSGIYCYIGPTLRGLIQHGTVFNGTRENALEKAAAAIKAQPLVKTLIVSGDALPSARLKVKTPGNALYLNYRRIAGKE